jgi:hypothetical protein
VIGIDAARERASRHAEGALAGLRQAGSPLAMLIRHIVERTH